MARTKRMTAACLFAIALVAAAACSSSGGSSASTSTVVPSAACKASMKAFHDGLVSTGNNLTNPQRRSFEIGTVQACTRAEWLTAVKAYTGNPITEIVIGTIKPTTILASFCKNDSTAKACR